MKEKIAIIGSGNLGSAIALGLVKARLVSGKDITVTRRQVHKLDALKKQGMGVSADNVGAVKKSAIIILCVQPKQLPTLLQEIGPALNAGKHILVSTITGITTEEISGHLGKKMAIVRAMPNTAIALGASMTCICAKDSSDSQLSRIQELFNGLGHTLVIEERLMKAATVLAASGIAFFMRYIRAVTQGGIQLGFDADEALEIAVQTAKGGATLLQENKTHPETEIDKVTTPEGCTIAGLNEMEHQGLSSALIKGIISSFEKISNIRK